MDRRSTGYYCVGRPNRYPKGQCNDTATFAVHAQVKTPGPTVCAQHLAQMVRRVTSEHGQEHVVVITLPFKED